MSDLQPQPDTKSSKEVLQDFFLEIIGYERGIYRTYIDLKKQPRVVVENYLAKTHKYVGPFKILISIVGAWLVFNNFVLDWYKIWAMAIDTYTKWLHQSEVLPADMLYMNKVITRIAGDLFSKYYMLFVILGTPLWAYICYRSCKAYNIDFRTHLAVVGYHFSLSFIPSFLLIICIAINFWVFVVVGFTILLSPVIGLRGLYNMVHGIVPVRSFFAQDGLIIEKKYYRAKLLMTFSSIILYSIISYSYYSIYPIQ